MTRRVVRLLVLLGAVVAAYLVLILFDHAARADAGSIDHPGATDPVASVKIVAASTRLAIPEPKSVVPKAPRPTIRAKAKTQAPYVLAGQTVRPAQVRTSKLRQSTSAAVQNIVRATVTPARQAVVRRKLTAAAQAALRPGLPALPQAGPAAWPQLPARPQLPSRPEATKPVLTQTPTSAGAPVLHQPLMMSLSAQLYPLPRASAFVAASGLSSVTKPSAAPARPLTTPRPGPPRQPNDFSTTTGQARDSGGGDGPSMGTVSSSWRPEVAAVGCRLATDVITRGRTVRYAGPPS